MTDKTIDNLPTNHLINENSPYLLAHAHNPVDWYPWGKEALERARAEDKPVFLSIGYAACHWCHVMEHESFENDSIAAILNENFICIKVDREQRPDLDQIYMSFTTALTGAGGWPMSVFLTPDLKPFFAGTYFPPDDRYGRPGFKHVLTEIAKAYKTEKLTIVKSASDIYDSVTARIAADAPPAEIDIRSVELGARNLMRTFDDQYGGFGQQPKFPHATELSLFIRHYSRSKDTSYLEAAEKALTNMARGGIYDQIGGGFARYSTDRQWLVPHFEKMLYDNALLLPVYAEAYQVTKKPFYLQIIRETLDFMLREMTDSAGGFYSSLDADSEGEEGKFYLWTIGEIRQALGDDTDWLINYYNVTEQGNFEGKNILFVDSSSDRQRHEAGDDFDSKLQDTKQKMLAYRAQRVRPSTDDKILTSWNGLALTALCKGYQLTGDRRYLDAAVKNAEFVMNTLDNNGLLTHSYRNGRHSDGQFLEDYGYYISGLIDLYETDVTSNARWLQNASTLAKEAVELFMDDSGRLYLRPPDRSDLIYRPREETDGSLPSAGSYLILGLLKLNRLTGEQFFADKGELALKAVSGMIDSLPNGMASALFAVDYLLNDKIEIVMVGDDSSRDSMLSEIYKTYIPNSVIALSNDGHDSSPLFKGRQFKPDTAMVYICRNSTCKLPVSTLPELRRQLDQL